MRGASEAWLGPLVGPECRRAIAKGWLFLARGGAALLSATIALAILWWWWINWNEAADPDFSPYRALRAGLTLLIGLATTVALVFGPAVVAGSLSGEQERGSMGLLLTTRVSALEIVIGRLAGRLTQVWVVLLAMLPPMLLLGFLSAMRPSLLGVMFLYGPGLALGASGLTAGVAVLSRRGRDALLGSYAIGLALLLTPLLADLVRSGGITELAPLNPFGAVVPLVWQEDAGPALRSLGSWLTMGGLGAVVAVVFLRPRSLRWLDGSAGRFGAGWRVKRRRVKPMGDRPMLWKEIFIERRNSLGGLGKWLGALAVLYLVLASVTLAGLYLDALVRQTSMEVSSTRLVWFQRAIVDTAPWFSLFLAWAVGLRAAVAIASERERGTWDALLTSPLEGSEIVAGKLIGSLHALRWLILAMLLAWSLALGIGAMEPGAYVIQLTSTLVVMTFMAAVGVRVSLGASSVTTAMALTIGAWLSAWAGLALLALLGVGIVALGLFLAWLIADRFGLTTSPTPWFPLDFATSFTIVRLALYAVVTAVVVIESRTRFDRLAGRIVPGEAWIPDDWVEVARVEPGSAERLAPAALDRSSAPRDPHPEDEAVRPPRS
ncbi:ABC transporter permease subunit [Tautonia marina]|uniref:ABC transporter permease subunit n=1 Tax=Tautonia marina TaxID=2653855 RepID=UPI0012604B0E|nr:ABC transporter permease subunit [Tautonia marina]